MAGDVNVATLVAKLEANTRDFDRDIKGAQTQLGRLGGSADGAAGGLGGMAKAAKGVAVALGAAGLVRFAGQAITSASDLEESINAVRVVFGDAADEVLAFSGDTSDAVFEAQSVLNQLATVTGSLLTNFGYSAQQAAQETITLSERAADMASVFNVDVGEALGAVNAALRGETEPIRRFGVNLDEATVKAKALELGLWDGTGALDQHAKVAARVALVMEQTAKVEGDAANTADSFANQQKALNEQLEVFKVAVGESLLPVLQELLPSLIKILGALEPVAKILGAITGFLTSGSSPFEIMAKTAPESSRAMLDMSREIGVAWLESVALENATRDLAAAIDAGNDQIPETVGGYGDMAEGADGATGSLLALADAQLALTDPMFKAISAAERLAETFADIDEDGQRTEAELVRLAEAQLRANAAFAAFDASDQEAAIRAFADAAGLSVSATEQLLINMGLLDGKVATVKVNYTTSGSFRFGGGKGDIEFRAAGGPVSAGSPYIVGERGPEMFVPERSGSIVPSGGFGGGGGMNVVLSVVGSDRLTEALRESLRVETIRGGSLEFN